MASRLACSLTIAALFGTLAGCAATRSAQETVSGWFGGSANSSNVRPQARYARIGGVALHRTPDASSEVVGNLALHEGVLRYQLEDGFAYVKSEKSGSAGWVREAELIERLPVAKKPVVPAPGGSPEPATTPEEPSDAAEPPAPEEPPAARPEKSIFDPY